jgi:hypothetical protein
MLINEQLALELKSIPHKQIAIQFVESAFVKEPWKTGDEFTQSYGLRYSHQMVGFTHDKIFRVFAIENVDLCYKFLTGHSDLITFLQYTK